MLQALKLILSIFMFPKHGRWGDILFLVRIPSALASASLFVSVHYLLNQMMDFDQNCINTLLGGGEELMTLT